MQKREEYRLRLLEQKDLSIVLEWRNSYRVRSNMFNDHIISMDEHLAWFFRLQQGNDVCLIFEWQELPVGVVSFVDVEREHHTCHWGFYLGQDGLPPGMGTVMGYLGLEYAFDTLRVDCVIGEVLAFNKASIRFHNRLGFQTEDSVKTETITFFFMKSDWSAIKNKLKQGIFNN